MALRYTTVTILLVFVSCLQVTALGATDAEILLKFKASLKNADPALSSWTPSSVPCVGDKPQWFGVLCWQGKIWGLKLENMGLSGVIDVDALTGLPNLRSLSFMNNNFQGPLPDVKKLTGLKNLYMSSNHLSGDIPDDAFDQMAWLKKVYLAHNQFTGHIPSSLSRLHKLLVLRLDDNDFTGTVPEFPQKGLNSVNISMNQLEGPVPNTLTKMNESLFAGNENLCGGPLTACADKEFYRKVFAIVMSVMAVVCALLLIFAAVMFVRRQQNRRSKQMDRTQSVMSKPKKMSYDEEKQISSQASADVGKKSDNGKLLFVRDDRERFDLPDLLKASAEILGSGIFGSSYKAALMTGPVMVAKRFRQMNNVGREDFHEHMRRLGRLRHPNLLSLVAYYYRKEEKLLVSDFVENGSLAHHLHGNRRSGNVALDWPARLKIVKGIAKGLRYLYEELPSLMVTHGHLKSCNVLLNQSFEPLLTDYCLLPVINKDHAAQHMIAYKSPEFAEHGRLSSKTDVWSMGILILEMLTGRFPENYLSEGKPEKTTLDLAEWVNSAVEAEEGTIGSQVFDKELLRESEDAEEEMLKLLKIALRCCEKDVDKRLDMKEATEKIEELEEKRNE